MSVVTKDSSVWSIIGELARRLPGLELQVVDHWDADLCAVGLGRPAAPDRIVYISTFRQAHGRCAYECERGSVGRDHDVTERRDDATLEQVLDAVRRHLGIDPAELEREPNW